MNPSDRSLERNLQLYGWYFPLSRTYFWSPIFFLFFSERFSIEQILQLQSLYYVSAVVLEVPSGYLSDRVSRTATLLMSALASVLSYALFFFNSMAASLR